MAVQKMGLGIGTSILALGVSLLTLAPTPACALGARASLFGASPVMLGQQSAANAAVTRVLGTITAITSNTLTVQQDHGQPVTVTLPSSARLLRLEPGQHTLSAATPITLSDIAVGDRVFVRGSADSGSVAANIVVAMKRADIATRQAQEQEAWEQNGVGGIVRSVDPAKGTIELAFENKLLTVQVTPTTNIRSYAQDSASFSNTQPATLAQIAAGDQLRALGEAAPINGLLTAKVVVFGSFQNIAATVTSVDAGAKTVTVKDLATHHSMTLSIGPDSQLRELPASVADRLAMLLKARAAREEKTPSGGSPQGPPMATEGSGAGNHPDWHHHFGGPGQAGPHSGGVLAMSTPTTLEALHPGEAVLIVATRATADHHGTALTLLTGVEAMLHASAEGSRDMLSSSWSLSGGSSGGSSSGNSGGPQS